MNEQDFPGGVGFECEHCKNFDDAGEFQLICRKCVETRTKQLTDMQVAHGKLMTEYQNLRDRAQKAGILITPRPSGDYSPITIGKMVDEQGKLENTRRTQVPEHPIHSQQDAIHMSLSAILILERTIYDVWFAYGQMKKVEGDEAWVNERRERLFAVHKKACEMMREVMEHLGDAVNGMDAAGFEGLTDKAFQAMEVALDGKTWEQIAEENDPAHGAKHK